MFLKSELLQLDFWQVLGSSQAKAEHSGACLGLPCVCWERRLTPTRDQPRRRSFHLL